MRFQTKHLFIAITLASFWFHGFVIGQEYYKQEGTALLVKVIRQRDQAQRELGGLKTMQALGLPR
jgi:hypothetical protein